MTVETRLPLDIGLPLEIQTPDGVRLSVAGFIEQARQVGTERGDRLYDAFVKAWSEVRALPLCAEEKANLAFNIAAKAISCPVRPENETPLN